jgi:hypothetical protein
MTKTPRTTVRPLAAGRSTPPTALDPVAAG